MADAQKTLSTQAIESIGRGHLVGKLIREGIGISIPIWDDGVDLIAHSFENDEFTAVPLQLKVSTNSFVGVEHKYRSKTKIKLVFVWIDHQDQLRNIFVMSYAELCNLFAKHNHTKSWRTGFSTSHASKEKLHQMKRFELSEGRTLRQLIFEM